MYHLLDLSKHRSILVVAPHPDDEAVGCGGLLARFGAQCDVLLLTDGRKGTPADGSRTEEETAAIREAEFEAAAAFFGVRKTILLRIPDGSLRERASAVAQADLRPYDIIFVPNRLERHPDHAAAYQIIKKLRRRQHAKAELLEYEVWSPITAPNRFLDVSEAMERKLAGIRIYESQVKELNYEALASSLNAYRGAPHHVPFCEAFFSESAARREEKQEKFARLPGWLRKLLLRCRSK